MSNFYHHPNYKIGDNVHILLSVIYLTHLMYLYLHICLVTLLHVYTPMCVLCKTKSQYDLLNCRRQLTINLEGWGELGKSNPATNTHTHLKE